MLLLMLMIRMMMMLKIGAATRNVGIVGVWVGGVEEEDDYAKLASDEGTGRGGPEDTQRSPAL
jgi:hypothetical protein